MATMTAAAAVAAGGLAFAGPVPAAQAEPRRDAVQQSIDKLVGVDRHPGALAAVRDRHGRTRHYTAGVGDLRTGGKVPTNGRVRIGSASKMFASVVVLQLVGEGRVELDASIETYLPGLVRGKGIDATAITVRQVLQHNSGLPDYTDSMFKTKADFLPHQHVYLKPRQLLDLANAREDARSAGSGWSYSNTNYVIAGAIVNRASGLPFFEFLQRRIFAPLGMTTVYNTDQAALPHITDMPVLGDSRQVLTQAFNLGGERDQRLHDRLARLGHLIGRSRLLDSLEIVRLARKAGVLRRQPPLHVFHLLAGAQVDPLEVFLCSEIALIVSLMSEVNEIMDKACQVVDGLSLAALEHLPVGEGPRIQAGSVHLTVHRAAGLYARLVA